ncbi:MAG: DMT family transporter [Bacteriovoracaceae bacterium]|jgi:drug/metabolite transporter (DMT)-like permease|nr:DMT family transporter [Bacteriovoracaceae bacterium]
MNIAYFYALLAALFWGLGFIGSRFGLEEMGPLWVSACRFIMATFVIVPLILKRKLSLNYLIRNNKGAFICAFFLSMMICLQVAGLEYTSVAKSGFITVLYAFFTPVICLILYKNKIRQVFWGLLAIAFFGMMMLCDFNYSSLNFGDFLTFCCAIFSAFHIIGISRYSKNEDFLLFNFKQLTFVAILTTFIAYLFEGIPNSFIEGSILNNHAAIGGIVFMGVFSTGVAFSLQMKAQEVIDEHVAGLIYLLESPIAAIFGYFVFAETLSEIAIIGCILITLSVALMPFINSFKMIKIKKLLPTSQLVKPTYFIFVISLAALINFGFQR